MKTHAKTQRRKEKIKDPTSEAVTLVRLNAHDFRAIERGAKTCVVVRPVLIKLECQRTKARIDAVVETVQAAKGSEVWMIVRRAD